MVSSLVYLKPYLQDKLLVGIFYGECWTLQRTSSDCKL